MKIEVYSRKTPHCPYCENAKKWLQSNKLDFVDMDINDGTNLADLEARLGQAPRSVPQIFINDEFIGGFNELTKSDLAKSLINRDIGGLSL